MTEKQKVIEEFQLKPKDTGSSEVQIALLTKKIKGLIQHFNIHKKDFHSMRGLMKTVSHRKKLLASLKRKDQKSYEQVVKRLSLRK